ncbi:MAG: LolA family protein [Candidatus Limnocylindrales bacterium]
MSTPPTKALAVRPANAPPPPELVVAPSPDAPSLSALFMFMRDAESRFATLRMRLVDRTLGTDGERVESHEVWLRHPGQAKVVTRFDDLAAHGASRVWISDGITIRMYDSRSRTASARPVRNRVRGATDPALPTFGQVHPVHTELPMESLPNTFIHPNGLCRNVLATADLSLLGTARLNGREIYLLRADHPRTTKILIDRPDHDLEVGVDRFTGIVMLLIERVGDQVTRHAEVTSLEPDAPIDDAAFVLHVPEDAHTIF